MLPLTGPAPTTAERIRSACARAVGALLAVDREDPVATPIHHLLCDGSFAVAVPVARTGVSGSQALLELTDYAPLPVREPVRSLVWVRGRLQQVPPAAVTRTLDLIATECPNPAVLQVETPRSKPSEETRYALMRLEIASVVVTDAAGAESVSVKTCLQLGPTRSARSSQPCSATWPPPITTWSRDWCPSCRRRCGADRPTRWVSTDTACDFASKATTGTTTSGCPSTSRSTT
jgi:hypothetical protein